METTLNLGGPLNALSLSPDGLHLITAGRSVLKIVTVSTFGNSELRFAKDLRLGRTNLNYSSNDVKWHPLESHKNWIASAATNGAVVVWNIDRDSPKQEVVINDHTRTVNRVCWHPENPFSLISGSQDGTMKLWDIRDPQSKIVFSTRSESVRDVQFNNFYTNYFACGVEDGTLQIWDIRKPNQPERKMTAHQGLVLSVDWHPDDKSLIASSGRDCKIQVWDLNGGKPISTIQTISSVGKIRWRPGFRHQIASSGSVVDFDIHIWDIRKTYIPLVSLRGHRDVATGFVWNRTSEHLISCSKDSTLIYHDIHATAYRPYEHICTTALTWSPHSTCAIYNEQIDRRPPHERGMSHSSGAGGPGGQSGQGGPPAPPAGVIPNFQFFSLPGAPAATPPPPPPPPIFQNESASPRKRVIQIYSPIGDAKYQNIGLAPEHYILEHLARNYKYKGLPFSQLCEINAKVAAETHQYQTAQTWLIIRSLFEPLPKVPKRKKNQPQPGSNGSMGSSTSSSLSTSSHSRSSSTATSPTTSPGATSTPPTPTTSPPPSAHRHVKSPSNSFSSVSPSQSLVGSPTGSSHLSSASNTIPTPASPKTSGPASSKDSLLLQSFLDGEPQTSSPRTINGSSPRTIGGIPGGKPRTNSTVPSNSPPSNSSTGGSSTTAPNGTSPRTSFSAGEHGKSITPSVGRTTKSDIKIGKRANPNISEQQQQGSRVAPPSSSSTTSIPLSTPSSSSTSFPPSSASTGSIPSVTSPTPIPSHSHQSNDPSNLASPSSSSSSVLSSMSSFSSFSSTSSSSTGLSSLSTSSATTVTGTPSSSQGINLRSSLSLNHETTSNSDRIKESRIPADLLPLENPAMRNISIDLLPSEAVFPLGEIIEPLLNAQLLSSNSSTNTSSFSSPSSTSLSNSAISSVVNTPSVTPSISSVSLFADIEHLKNSSSTGNSAPGASNSSNNTSKNATNNSGSNPTNDHLHLLHQLNQHHHGSKSGSQPLNNDQNPNLSEVTERTRSSSNTLGTFISPSSSPRSPSFFTHPRKPQNKSDSNSNLIRVQSQPEFMNSQDGRMKDLIEERNRANSGMVNRGSAIESLVVGQVGGEADRYREEMQEREREIREKLTLQEEMERTQIEKIKQKAKELREQELERERERERGGGTKDQDSERQKEEAEEEEEDLDMESFFPVWPNEGILERLLEDFSQQGNVQMCVSLLLVLKDRMNLNTAQVTDWFFSYIELLHRLKLYTPANNVINCSPQPHINSMNRSMTTFHPNCPHCEKALSGPSYHCEHCHKLTSLCSLCHQTVRGLYVWCQGCNHGGHLSHLSEWFSKHRTCPTGCTHVCTLTPAKP